MSSFIVDRYAKSVIYPHRIKADSGSDNTGLAWNTVGFSIEWRVVGDATWTALSLVEGVEGVWGDSHFVERASGNAWYELGMPNIAIQPGKTTEVRVLAPGNDYRYGSISATGTTATITISGDPLTGDGYEPVTLNLATHINGNTWGGIPNRTLVDSDNNAISLVGAVVKMQVRDYQGSKQDPILDIASNTSGITIVNAAGGEFTVDEQVVSVDRTLSSVKKFYYDIQVVLSSGKVLTPISGDFPIIGDATR